MILINKSAIFGALLFTVLSIMLCCLVMPSAPAYAAVKDPSELGGASWENVMEYTISDENGWLQSMCVTDKYIICLNNSLDGEADTLIAFYKNNYDENNNPVQQYSYAKHITEYDYEHGNGMTYDPNTNEIVIATGGGITNEDNAGSVFIADADTLNYKRTVKVSDEWNVTGLDYVKGADQFILHASVGANFDYYITDSDFKILDVIESYPQDRRYAYQDICVSGDYILSLSYDMRNKLDNFIQVYSISQRSYLETYYLDLPGDEAKKESESICEIEPGKFIVGLGIVGPRRIRFYEGWVQAEYGVNTSAEKGTITESVTGLEAGGSWTVNYTPDKHYQLSELLVNGKPLDIAAYPTEYTFQNIQDLQQIQVVFKKLPKYKITASVQNGTITKSKKIYQSKSGIFSFEPDPNHELAKLLIDGQPVDIKGQSTSYTFENVQDKHSIEAIFKEIPSFTIKTGVFNGTISGGNEKVYRDSSQKITYATDKNQILFGVVVDGRYVDKHEYQDSYVFENIRKDHTIQVIYIWKYTIWCIGGIIIFAAWAIWYSQLLKRRRKRRIRK